MGQSCKVAVIGAGIAGLVTARELQREGHHVTVFEKANRVGGTWLYDPRAMSFLDYPFVKKEGGDPRPFPGHEEILRFLEDFATDFGLKELIRFEHEVVQVELVDEASHKSNEIITVDDNRVGPLYEHVFPPSLAPWLSFVGLPYMAVCMVLELQAKWVAKRFAHNLQYDEVEYKAWLAAQSDINLPKLLKEISVFSLVKARSRSGDDYRDTWDVEEWMQQMEASD
ncbi:hypothetical protein like AT5G61290 [Hibiscus trionum]|uniref:Flavin-containing monooxygenase n=1 Tax=Hibiscus trionum TaxID=183268 RepID=A0A9W7LJA5_HIBTR|nr:hypothetical protein like AT5G61290 [Hibiscus trionum]